MARVLIAYATKHGSTAEVAEAIAVCLRTHRRRRAWQSSRAHLPQYPNPKCLEALNDSQKVRCVTGCDGNVARALGQSQAHFMKGEGEPVEITRIKRDLEVVAADSEETGAWLSRAMEQAWGTAAALLSYPALADLLAEAAPNPRERLAVRWPTRLGGAARTARARPPRQSRLLA
jgi:hypothetical protein